MSINYKLPDNSESVRHQAVQARDVVFVYALAQHLLKLLPERHTICSKGNGWKEQNISMF